MWYDNYPELIKEIEKAAHNFYALRYQMSNGGNLSIRVPEKNLMIVKGTDIAFDEVAKENLVMTDFEGTIIEGNRKPSKEALLHGIIYKKLKAVNAIMHCHSPYATAWASHHNELNFSTHHSEMKLHGMVPVFDTRSYAVPKEYFPTILTFLEKNPQANAFLLRGHGQMTLGKDMRSAAYLAELVEETSQISILESVK